MRLEKTMNLRDLGPPDIDSLDLVEMIMHLEEEFGIDCSEDDWLQGSGVPRRGPFPIDSGAAELPLPTEDI